MEKANLLFAILFSLLIICVVVLGHRASLSDPDPGDLGDTFVACVEVIEVHPPPGANLHRQIRESGNFTVRVTFSRSVWKRTRLNYKWIQKSAHPFPNGRHMIFLTTNPVDVWWYYPESIELGRSRREIKAFFDFKDGKENVAKAYKKLHLVVDGGWFYTYDLVGSEHTEHLVFVPLTVFTEYVIENVDPIPVPPKSFLPSLGFQPSPYCMEPDMRNVPVPFLDNPLDFPLRVSTGDLNKLHISSHGTLTVNLLLRLKGTGDAIFKLPPKVVAEYKGSKVVVSLPSGEISLSKELTSVKVPVKVRLVYELRERLYHYKGFKRQNHLGMQVRHNASLLPKQAYTSYLSKKIETYDTATGLKIHDTSPDVRYWLKWGDYFFKSDYVRSVILRESVSYFPRLIFHEASKTATMFDFEMYDPERIGLNDMSTEHTGIYNKHITPQTAGMIKACPINSTRNYGRAGIVYNCVEFGSFYHLLTALGMDSWQLQGRVEAVSNIGGEMKNITDQLFHSVKQKVPHNLLKAVHKYGILVKPTENLVTDRNQPIHRHMVLDEGIFVPIEEARSSDCGGIMLFTNMKRIYEESESDQFCDRKFGSCIGLPFSSTIRHPVMPPFNLPEMAGWSEDRATMTAYGIPPSLHPVGRHFSEFAIPRATFVRHTTEDNYMVLLVDRASEVQVNLPLSGISILTPVVTSPGGQSPWDSFFCESVVKLHPLPLQDLRREAELVITVHNIGEDGDVIFNVECSNNITILKPTSKQMTIWIPSNEAASARFLLDGSENSDKPVAHHWCEFNVMIEIIFEELHLNQSDGAHSSNCSMDITTHLGYFTNPCAMQDSPLPQIDLKYYVLPLSQRQSSAVAFKEFKGSPVGMPLVFVRAIAIALTVATKEDEALLSNLESLQLKCLNPQVHVVEEDRLLFEAVESSREPLYTLPGGPIVFYSDFTARRVIYYFASSHWAKMAEVGGEGSGCSIEVMARRPHRLCSSNPPQVVSSLVVTLADSDTTIERESKPLYYQYLTLIYGEQSVEFYLAVVVCVGVSVVFLVLSIVGQSCMFIFRKRIPTQKMVYKLNRDLEKEKRSHNKLWENPQLYLINGLRGPYHHLYNFKGTLPLDTKNLKALKVTGVLKHKTKELKVVFGHIKKVFVDASGKKGHQAWLQASSGMYFLQLQDVSPDYKVEFQNFLRRSQS